MNRLFSTIAALALLTTPALAWDASDIQKTLTESTVSLNETCSGTMLNNTLILTANHCVSEQYSVVTRQKFDDKGVVKEEKVRIAVPGRVLKLKYRGPVETSRTSTIYKVKATNSDVDLALVEAMEPVGKGVAIGCNPPELLDKVYTLSNPLGVFFNTVTSGQISSLTRSYRDLNIPNSLNPSDDGEHGFIQHTAPIAPGSSGSGLFNDDGQLIGVNVRGTALGSIFLAVPTEDVKKFLNDNGVHVCGP